MSTIAITFNTQVLDFGPLVRGRIEIGFDYGQAVQLNENLTTGIAQNFYFQESVYQNDDQQAQRFLLAFLRDYKSVGAPKNINGAAVGNVVTLTAEIGTFTSFNYTGNVLIVNEVINNTPQASLVTFNVSPSATGDCSTVTYDATATGDDTPFKITVDGAEVVTAWDGTATTFTMTRGIPHTVRLLDNTDAVIDSYSAITPRNLIASEFQEVVTPYSTYSDIIIQKTVTIANTEPIEYAITDKDDIVGSNYQVSNSFTGIAPDQYRLWIKDVYGCETSRLLTISALQDATATENIRYFLIPDGQSVQFAELPTFDKDTKRNYFNTGSFNEFVFDSRYCIKQHFDPSDLPQGIQFQSSYPWHSIMLHDMNGGVIPLQPVMIQQNLGVIEKVDCGLWPVGTKTGVYFSGGNQYIENTTTVLGPSPYNGNTPRWAKVGQLVNIDGVGAFYVEQTGYDSDRGGYFIIDTTTIAETTGLVQVTYNAHNYNLFEVYFQPSQLTTNSFIVIEKGFIADEVEGNPYSSDIISSKIDSEDDVRVLWADSKNRGNLVFQSGIQFLFRKNGEFYGDFTNTESEVYAGDDQIYSLDQAAFLDFTVRFEMLSAKQINMLNIASGLETFNVNGINLVRKDTPSVTRLGKTNMHIWEGTFGYGGNQVGIQQDEVVLSVTTGVVGGGSTGQSQAPDLSGIILFKDSNNNLITLNTNLTKQ